MFLSRLVFRVLAKVERKVFAVSAPVISFLLPPGDFHSGGAHALFRLSGLKIVKLIGKIGQQDGSHRSDAPEVLEESNYDTQVCYKLYITARTPCHAGYFDGGELGKEATDEAPGGSILACVSDYSGGAT